MKNNFKNLARIKKTISTCSILFMSSTITSAALADTLKYVQRSVASESVETSDAAKANQLERSQARLLIAQTLILKNLWDLNYIDLMQMPAANIEFGHIRIKQLKHFGFNVQPTGYSTTVNNLLAGSTYSTTYSGVGLLTLAAGTSIGFALLDPATKYDAILRKEMQSMLVKTGLVSLGSAAVIQTLKSGNQALQKEQIENVSKQILSNAKFNSSVMSEVAATEALFNLKDKAAYVANRSTLISDYKSDLVSALLTDSNTADYVISKNKSNQRYSVSKSYLAMLLENKIVSESEAQKIKTISLFLRQQSHPKKGTETVSQSALSLAQAESLRDAAIGLQSEAKSEEQLKSLKDLQTQIEKEIQIISMLK